ncbi:hypothetical protein KM295_01020 [Natronomonas sp. F2-12]|jgi:hypothetical protein|uniref:Uncharacterized protein n=1 Tax=Natronomonas aquatica TaxID=2841590 RepID=A0A9R1CQ88_9EURY|nr:hypothetical protein [Natronomonas aquatica]MCQ4332087.1 hypothetical protein [Natronomonas aquatica]
MEVTDVETSSSTPTGGAGFFGVETDGGISGIGGTHKHYPIGEDPSNRKTATISSTGAAR